MLLPITVDSSLHVWVIKQCLKYTVTRYLQAMYSSTYAAIKTFILTPAMPIPTDDHRSLTTKKSKLLKTCTI